MQRIERQETWRERVCLTPEETARVLGIGRTFVYDLLATGRLGSFKLGRRRLVPIDAIDRLVAEERQRQAGEDGGQE